MFQDISKDVLLAVSRNQAKVHSENCVQGEWQLFTIPSKKQGQRDIAHSMSMLQEAKKSYFGKQEFLWFHI